MEKIIPAWREMLDRKDNGTLDMLFAFVESHINKANGFVELAGATSLHNFYSELNGLHRIQECRNRK